MPKQRATVPLCAPVDSNFEGIIKAKSVQKMPFCYVRREEKVTVYLCLSPYTMETNQCNVSGGT